MKSNMRKTNVLIIVGIFFAIAAVSSLNYTIEIRDETNLKSPKSSGYWTANFIHIDGNWSDTATTYAWCSGEGSWGNPYVIESVIINASTSPIGSGIFINNSKHEYFIIRNCTIYNAGGAYNAGIRLVNTNNGILISNNCSNNNNWGIFLHNNCNNNTVLGNTANTNALGIYLREYCNNTIISENIVNNNEYYGIYLQTASNNNTISENTAHNNGYYGIYFYGNCRYNNISGNTANDNSQNGIHLREYCEYNIISGNTANDNTQNGIYLHTGCNNNIISENTAHNNGYYGIYFYVDCRYNTISENTAHNNGYYGIYLWNYCNDNTIINNTINRNSVGILLYLSNNNTVSENTLIDNEYCIFEIECLDNTIENNDCSAPTVQEPIFIDGTATGINAHNWTWAESQPWCSGSGTWSDPYVIGKLKISGFGTLNGIEIRNSNVPFIIEDCKIYNSDIGIYLVQVTNSQLIDNNCSNNWGYGICLSSDCNNNTVSGNTANDNTHQGIYLLWYCSENTILGNTANNNGRGIYLRTGCNNNIISENTVNNNWYYGIYLWNDCNDNSILENTANNSTHSGIYLFEYCDNNTISGNTANNNNYGIYLSYHCVNNTLSGNTANNNYYGILLLVDCNKNTIKENYMYFNGYWAIDIHDAECDDNIIKRNVLVSKDERFINDIGKNTVISMNYELLSPPQLYVEILDQSFSIREFIIIINILSELRLDFSIQDIQMWWDGIIVHSNNITDLGNSLYNVSLTPIFVNPGDDPILLNMTISALGYVDGYFEIYIAVDPDVIDKDVGEPAEEFPLTIIIIAITSIAGGIGVAGVALILLRKRKRAHEGV